MASARGSYSVYGVIANVQNRKSDDEMESDTSDSNAKEEVENVDEVEKENQTSTDCPAADDEDIESSQPAKLTVPWDRYRLLKINVSGPEVTNGAVSFQTPLEYF